MKNTFTIHSYKILSLLLAIAMIFSMLPVTTFAETSPDDNTYATSGVTASGAQEDTPPDDNAYATSGVTASSAQADAPIGFAPAMATVTVSNIGELLSEISNFPSAGDDKTITVSGNIIIDSLLAIPANANGKTLTITGDTLTRGITGYLITVGNGAKLILDGITIDGDKDGDNNGNVAYANNCSLVFVVSSGELIMQNNAVLQNNAVNFSGSGGGGIKNNGKFTMKSGTIKDNSTVSYGGGVFIDASNSEFIMESGTITDNSAVSYGGGVYVNGTFNMSGGTITANTATGNGGGVYVNDTFNISGSPKIENNKKNSGGANSGGVYLGSGKTIAIDKTAPATGLSTGARIGIEGMVATGAGATVATNAVENDLQYFYISNDTGLIGTNNGFVLSGTNIVLETSATISPTTATFDKNPSMAADISVTLTLNGRSVNSVKLDGTELMYDRDYFYNPIFTIKKTFLSTLSVGTHTITFDMDGGTDPTLTLTVVDTTISPPNPSDPPTSPSSNGGSSSGGNNTAARASTAPTQWVDASDTKTLAKSAAEQGADSVRTSNSGEAGIRKNVLQTLGESGLAYRHDTVANGAVQVRMYVNDPSAATKDILVSGYTSGANADKTTAIINKWFNNDAAVIALDQQGDFGMNVRIAARVNLSDLNTSKLNFYSYNKATNKYKLIATEYRIDSKGYVHFSTVRGGSIIITDRPLTKIGADAEDETYELPMTGGGLDNPATGGDGTGMYIPPAKAQPQDFTVADSIVEAVAADGVLKLESNIVPAAIAGNAAGNSGGVLKINLDAPNVLDAAQESGKPSVGMIAGIAIALFFAAMILWAVIPRKNDPLISVEEYRKK